MTDADLSATLAGIKERARGATPGEWKLHLAEARRDWSSGSKPYLVPRVEADALPSGIAVFSTQADAEFTASAKSDIPLLVAALEAVLALTRDSEGDDLYHSIDVTVGDIREAITNALAGEETG